MSIWLPNLKRVSSSVPEMYMTAQN